MENDSALTARVQAVVPGIHVRLAVDNMAWIDLGDGLLVVDALEQPELEAEVFAAIERTAGDKPVRYVLNTHGHYDHVALNEAFRRRWNAEIVCQPAAGLPAEGRWFQGPARKVLMQPLPGCHTADDCIIWSPSDRVLFVGDIFGWGLIPCSRVDDRMAKFLIESHERLLAFEPRVVVGGHGPLLGALELRRWIEYFRWLMEGALLACAEGRSDDQVRESLPPPPDMRSWWRFEDWKHADSVEKVLTAVRRRKLTRNP
jgi:cyclase